MNFTVFAIILLSFTGSIFYFHFLKHKQEAILVICETKADCP